MLYYKTNSKCNLSIYQKMIEKVPSQDLDSLRQLIADRITAAGGHVSFSDYMQWALYEPLLGYYDRGNTLFGEAGDFVTAPELGTLFARALARGIAPLLLQTEARIIELGAGSGGLAKSLTSELDALGVPLNSYSILEPSGTLQERQKAILHQDARVQWLQVLPDNFSGVVIANEVLDAMPVKLACLKDGKWHERRVISDGGHFAFRDFPATAEFLNQVRESVPEDLAYAGLPEGYVTEIHPFALGFIRTLSSMMRRGKTVAIFVDYGFPAYEYYLPERLQGTLMCHYRHQVHDDPFFKLGFQDITSHVNFTSLARVAEKQGLDILFYASQASFLMASGILSLLPSSGGMGRDSIALVREAEKLLSPHEMGELFKVIILGHDVEPSQELLQSDRSGRL